MPTLLALLALTTAAASPVWFVCDGIDRPVAYVVGRNGTRSTVTTIAKATGRGTAQRLTLGREDAGMGQLHQPLLRGRRTVGDIHRVNPGMVDQPQDVRPATVTSVTLDGRATQCRWVQGLVANGVTARRGVTITQEPDGLTYRSFDFARPTRLVRPDGVQRTTVASNTIPGGVERRLPDGTTAWRFTKAGWTTEVRLAPSGGATLIVSRGQRVVQQEDFLGLAARP